MGHVLFQYHPVNPTTWVYFSSLLLIALFFKFNRLWSVRNLDLIGLMMLSPGLLLVYFGRQQHDLAIERGGYVWLFGIGGLFIVRLLLDSIMVRRPFLEPNLSAGGLTFLGASLFIFLMANVLIIPRELVQAPPPAAPADMEEAPPPPADMLEQRGPGNPLLFRLSDFWSQPYLSGDPRGEEKPIIPMSEAAKTTSPPDNGAKADSGTPKVEAEPAKAISPPGDATESRDLTTLAAARITAIVGHLLVILGVVLIGRRHFDNLRTGVATATLYLLLPYTAQWTGQVMHVVPAAILVWLVLFYRRPLVAGALMGVAIGTFYYALFLLPLWISFYSQRGWRRFLCGLVVGAGAILALLWFTSPTPHDFWQSVRQTFGLTLPLRDQKNFEGFWGLEPIDAVYRLPTLAAFVVISCALALWPSQKNLGTLLSCSAVVMLGAQFWHSHRGGLYVAWYLPLMLLTIFRPNLDDRVALSVLTESWFRRKRAATGTPTTGQAA